MKEVIFLLKKYLSFFSILFFAFTVNAYSARVSGYVIESVKEVSSSGSDKISGALVVIEGSKFQATTNSNGYFAFPENIPDGVYSIKALKEGYNFETKKLTVLGRDSIDITFVLTKQSERIINSAPNIPDAVYVAFASTTEQSPASRPVTTSLESINKLLLGNYPNIDIDPQNKDFTPVNHKPTGIGVMDPYNPKNTEYLNFNRNPYWLTFDNSGTKLFISTSLGPKKEEHHIVILDITANKIVGFIPTNGAVTDITRAPDGNIYASVSGISKKGIMVISSSTNSKIAFYEAQPSSKMPKDAQPSALAVDLEHIYVAIASNLAGEVQVLKKSGGVMIGACEVGKLPSGICLTPNGKYLFVANYSSGDVSIVDTSRMSVLGRVKVGANPARIASSPLGDRIYVTNSTSNYVSVIDGKTGKIIATVNTGKGPAGIAVTPDGARIIVANNKDKNITIIDGKSNSVIQTTMPSVRSSPLGIAVKP